jgi:Cu(I)/Ag(I) efflux system membrane fusion protein
LRIIVDVDVPVRDAALLSVNDPVEATCAALAPRGPWLGTVAAIEPQVSSFKQRVRVHVECPRRDLPAGATAELAFRTPLAEVEPFRSLPRDPPPLSAQDTRTVYICPDHRDVIALRPGVCPRDSLELAPEPLSANQRVSFWCPMHPQITASSDGQSCAQCQGMKLLPRVLTYAPPGQVLAVPESAAIITGKQQIVYVESGPGMFDGVEVKLGPKAEGYYAVLEGLSAGQRVAAAGAFLIDAETQLNPHLAAAYFGAGSGSSGSGQSAPATKAEKDHLAGIKLSPADMALARRQKVCPVTKMPLGSMGKPVRVEAAGRITFLCCEGCRTKFLDSVSEAAKND